jgi:tRNA G18 (ribose-2'-O)-methylase SpoU
MDVIISIRVACQKTVSLMGNEANGISKELEAHHHLSIPRLGSVQKTELECSNGDSKLFK